MPPPPSPADVVRQVFDDSNWWLDPTKPFFMSGEARFLGDGTTGAFRLVMDLADPVWHAKIPAVLDLLSSFAALFYENEDEEKRGRSVQTVKTLLFVRYETDAGLAGTAVGRIFSMLSELADANYRDDDVIEKIRFLKMLDAGNVDRLECFFFGRDKPCWSSVPRGRVFAEAARVARKIQKLCAGPDEAGEAGPA